MQLQEQPIQVAVAAVGILNQVSAITMAAMVVLVLL
jgi:hypothetical protein